MEEQRFRSCMSEERFYDHGDRITEKGELLECVDGKWENGMIVSGI
ncbi:MAG: hypothetical protein LLG06_15095 [Desulfobacteraceae bacterium]|nr:hypothetical protein [Desulfobacteraceae bacterium]